MIEIPDSYLARRNPVLKLGVLLALSLMLTSIFDPVTPALFFLLGVVAARLLGKVRLTRLLRALAPVMAAALGILIANFLFGRVRPGDEILVRLGPFVVSQYRLLIGGSIAVRILAFASLSLCFALTTEPSAFLLSLVHQLRLSYRFAFGVLAGYRIVPILQMEYQYIRDAQRARGLSGGGGPVAALWRIRRYAIPLMAGGVRRASRIAQAMDARAFGAYPQRTYRRTLVVDGGDWLFLIACFGLAATLLAVLTSFGIARFGVGV